MEIEKSKEELGQEDKEKKEITVDNSKENSETSHIYVIKVTTNKEDRALELISDKVTKKNLQVYSLTRPHGLRGYIFLESIDRETAEEAAYNLPYVKGIIGKTVTYEEIQNMLTPNLEEVNIAEGDIIEIIGEPFKKEKAKITRVDKSKGEVVATLLGAIVPMPVTLKIDNVKVIRRGNESEESEEDKGYHSMGENESENKTSLKKDEDHDKVPSLGEVSEEEFEGPEIGGL